MISDGNEPHPEYAIASEPERQRFATSVPPSRRTAPAPPQRPTGKPTHDGPTSQVALSPHDRIMDSIKLLERAVLRVGDLADRIAEGESPDVAQDPEPDVMPLVRLLDFTPHALDRAAEALHLQVARIEDMLFGPR